MSPFFSVTVCLAVASSESSETANSSEQSAVSGAPSEALLSIEFLTHHLFADSVGAEASGTLSDCLLFSLYHETKSTSFF